MTQLIIYKNDENRLAVITPAQEWVDALGIAAIAAKDVPTGKPYKIIDASELPADKSQRMGWTVDDAELTDGVGA